MDPGTKILCYSVSVYEDALFDRGPSGVTESFMEGFKKAEYLWGISTKL